MSGRERVFAICTRCDNERAHYTRADGTKVSPCVACSRKLAKARAAKDAADPARVEARRAAYRRYNASEKGKARLKRRSQHPHLDGDGPTR